MLQKVQADKREQLKEARRVGILAQQTKKQLLYEATVQKEHSGATLVRVARGFLARQRCGWRLLLR